MSGLAARLMGTASKTSEQKDPTAAETSESTSDASRKETPQRGKEATDDLASKMYNDLANQMSAAAISSSQGSHGGPPDIDQEKNPSEPPDIDPFLLSQKLMATRLKSWDHSIRVSKPSQKIEPDDKG